MPRALFARGGLIALAGMTLVVSLFAMPARADAGSEWDFVARINALRAAHGLGELSIDPRLTTVARVWSASMAARNVLEHNQLLPYQVSGWTKLGENVGDGATVEQLEQAFEASPSHNEHLVDPRYTRIGVGVAFDGNGRMWVTQLFMRPRAPQVVRAPAPQSFAPVPGAALTAAASAPGPARADPASPPSVPVLVALVRDVSDFGELQAVLRFLTRTFPLTSPKGLVTPRRNTR
ncbi:MAG TPA: CAP domain-containing protein [Acidimicrobiales bacterium]|nr:CAP domain-containing protein [Acidimicrobiales bacterium]